MQEININEMKQIEGGGTITTSVLIVSIIAVVIDFVSGILSGYGNPPKCRN